MKHRMGFTLLEVLIVTVIAVSITVFSVPFFKRTQERNKSLAAQGVLADIGNALQTLRSDYIGAGVAESLVPSGVVQLMKTHQTTSETDYKNAKNQTEIGGMPLSLVPYALFAREYMQPIPFSSSNTNSHYKYYKFYLCPAGGTTENHCCKFSKVACMSKSGCTANEEFPGAYVDQGGLVVQVDKASPENVRKAMCGLS